MPRLTVNECPLKGLKLVTRSRHGDQRGFLSRIFCKDELLTAGWINPIAQINHSYTAKKGTVRGLHFQHTPYAEMKLVTCIRGEVWDVAVDVRRESPTFLKHHAETLSAENGRALLIPEGFAHGFQALSDDVELLYCHSQPYMPDAEAGLNPLDPALAIDWPLAVAELSLRDAGQPMLNPDFKGVVL